MIRRMKKQTDFHREKKGLQAAQERPLLKLELEKAHRYL